MKKIDNFLLVAGVVVVLGGIGLVFFSNLLSPTKQKAMPTPKPLAVQELEFSNLMKSVEVGAPDVAGRVKLKNGIGDFSGGTVNFVSFLGLTPTSGNSADTFGSFAANYGGSGSFVYVALFSSNSKGLVFQSRTNPLGDRIIIKSATAFPSMTASYVLTVKYLERKPTDPMSTPPSVPKTVEFQVKNHIIQTNEENTP